jgi:hypothetical protein
MRRLRSLKKAKKYMPVSFYFYIGVIAVLFVFLSVTMWKGGWLLETWRARTAALPRLAVASFTVDSSGVRADAATARSLVESYLAATGKYRIMTGEEIDSLLALLEIPRGDILGEESVKKLYLQNIAYIVTGSMDALEKDYVVTLTALYTGTGQLVCSGNGLIDSQELPAGVNALTEQFAAGMPAKGEKEMREIYRTGSKGPGGGTIFFAKGGVYKECGGDLGTDTWENAMAAAKNYRGGGYTDWYLPAVAELKRIRDHRLANDFYWSSEEDSGTSSEKPPEAANQARGWNFGGSSAYANPKDAVHLFRAVRTF